MRIAIAGKGGSGKTTIAAAIIAELTRRDRRVLAIDGDTNPNLAAALGLPARAAFELAVLPPDLLVRHQAADGTAYTELRMSANDVLDQYGTAVGAGVRMLVMGRIDHAGAG